MKTLITAALMLVATTFTVSAASARTAADVAATNACTDDLIAEQLAALSAKATPAPAAETSAAIDGDARTTDWWTDYLNTLALEEVAKRRAAGSVALGTF